MNFQMFKLILEKAEEPDQIANICWIIKKAREFHKNVYFCFIDYTKAFDCVDYNKLSKRLKEMGIPDHPNCRLEIWMQVKKQHLELDMKQQTGFKLVKEYVKAVYCHPVYWMYMQSTSREKSNRMKHKLESKLLGEISTTSDMQITPSVWQKWRRSKESLAESERREWKSWLKTQLSEN